MGGREEGGGATYSLNHGSISMGRASLCYSKLPAPTSAKTVDVPARTVSTIELPRLCGSLAAAAVAGSGPTQFLGWFRRGGGTALEGIRGRRRLDLLGAGRRSSGKQHRECWWSLPAAYGRWWRTHSRLRLRRGEKWLCAQFFLCKSGGVLSCAVGLIHLRQLRVRQAM